MITQSSPSKQLKSKSENFGIKILHYEELKYELIDFRQYFHAVLQELNQDKDIDLYIPLRSKKYEEINSQDLFTHVKSFLDDDNKCILILLGDYGSGKTTFLKFIMKTLVKHVWNQVCFQGYHF